MSAVARSTFEAPEDSRVSRLPTFAWGVLAYNLVVILWGAFVRATGSGAGCGKHWPLCNGDVVPHAPSTATMIEASHRVTSGIAAFLVLGLVIWTMRALPKGHRARRAAILSGVFILGEVVIGAGLVLFELVAHDASMKRGLSMMMHLGNTFLLLGALAITAWTLRPRASGLGQQTKREPAPRLLRIATTIALVSVLALASSGGIAALGDTLFPSHSLREGLAQDLSPLAHVFLRLRVLHPMIALATGIIVFATATLARVVEPSPIVKKLSRGLTVLFVVQFAAGLLNVSLLAPVWMQLVHLLLADLTWIVLVLLTWEARWGAMPSLPVADREAGRSS